MMARDNGPPGADEEVGEGTFLCDPKNYKKIQLRKREVNSVMN